MPLPQSASPPLRGSIARDDKASEGIPRQSPSATLLPSGEYGRPLAKTAYVQNKPFGFAKVKLAGLSRARATVFDDVDRPTAEFVVEVLHAYGVVQDGEPNYCAALQTEKSCIRRFIVANQAKLTFRRPVSPARSSRRNNAARSSARVRRRMTMTMP